MINLNMYPVITKYSYLWKSLKERGFECYIVGGAVRDILLNHKFYDLDLATNARPDDIIDIFKDIFVKCVGKQFGVVLVDNIEIATYRNDSYFGLSDKLVDIKFSSTIEEDLERRDFTINSMALNPFTGDIIDPYGGIIDLQNGVIKFTGDADQRIFEDPNRILRACRFSAKLNFKIDHNDIQSLRSNSLYVKNNIAPERIRLEILKTMTNQHASRFFMTLHHIYCLRYIFPSLESCWDHSHGSHHSENVFEHNMLCGDYISCKYPLLKLAGYLHDCGKPKACTINPKTGKIYFKGHSEFGAELAENELRYLKFSNYEICYICSLIACHMDFPSSSGSKATRRLLFYLDKQGIPYKDFIRLRIADRKGNLKSKDYTFSEKKSMVSKFRKEIYRSPENNPLKGLVINGNDVMENLKISPGPKVGQVLNSLLQLVMDNPDMNNRSYLIDYLQKGENI